MITVYSDRSFEFKIKCPPAAVLIKLAAKIPAGKKQGKEVIPPDAKKGGKYKGFSLTKKQVAEIAKKKFNDLNARDRGPRRAGSSKAPPAAWASRFRRESEGLLRGVRASTSQEKFSLRPLPTLSPSYNRDLSRTARPTGSRREGS